MPIILAEGVKDGTYGPFPMAVMVRVEGDAVTVLPADDHYIYRLGMTKAGMQLLAAPIARVSASKVAPPV